MTTEIERRWTDLKAELAKAKAEAEVRGGAMRDELKRMLEDIETRSSTAAAAGKDGLSATAEQAGDTLASAKEALQEVWRKLQK